MTRALVVLAVIEPHTNPNPAGFMDGVIVTVLALIAVAAFATWRAR
jgi:hypothetical protein